MEENRTDELLSEAAEGTVKVDAKRQIGKYVVLWLAIVGLFLAFNVVIKSVAATKTAAEATGYNGGYYASGQPAGYGQAGGGSGGCGGECCGTGGGGGGTLGNAGQAGDSKLKQIEKAAIDWYAQQTGDRDVTAEVKDFGCHHEIDIKKNGKVVSELSFRNGQFSSLTPW